MGHILNIETSTSVCSVSVSSGTTIMALRESMVDRSHAALLTILIDEVMHEAGKNFRQLSAVAVSKGPGSYTGLRIGVSTAKGISYAADLPLIATDTMKTMALKVIRGNLPVAEAELKKHGKGLLLCPMIDARRMEVYMAVFNRLGEQVKEVGAEIIDESSMKHLLDHNKVLFFGDGAEKCIKIMNHVNAIYVPGIYPSAEHMAELSARALINENFEDTAYFEPFYLKDFLATTPKNKLGHNQPDKGSDFLKRSR